MKKLLFIIISITPIIKAMDNPVLPLWFYVKATDIESFETYINRHKGLKPKSVGIPLNLNYSNPDFRPIIFDVIEAGSIPMLTILFANGADLNVHGPDNITPLMLAVQLNLKIIVIFLLQHKALVDIQDYKGNTALIYAINRNDPDIQTVQLLLNYGANPLIKNNAGQNALTFASDAIVNRIKVKLDIRGNALLEAATDGNLGLAGKFLHMGVEADYINRAAENALEHAIVSSDLRVLNLLLISGAKIREAKLNECLVRSARFDNEKVTRKILSLLDAHHINAVDENQDTALIWATVNNNINLVREILKQNPDINQKDNNGWTAVHYAAYKGYAQIFRVLLLAGANIKIKTGKNGQGKNAIEWARHENNRQILSLFV